jgi:hypothetical protein
VNKTLNKLAGAHFTQSIELLGTKHNQAVGTRLYTIKQALQITTLRTQEDITVKNFHIQVSKAKHKSCRLVETQFYSTKLAPRNTSLYSLSDIAVDNYQGDITDHNLNTQVGVAEHNNQAELWENNFTQSFGNCGTQLN